MAVFNYNIPLKEAGSFWKSVAKTLKKDGQLVATIAENEIVRLCTGDLQNSFKNIRICRMEPGTRNFPHANLVVAKKK